MWQGMLAAPTDASNAFADVMQPVLIGVGTGVVLGGIAATGLCILVPWLRPGRDRG